jgi:hypothetical protein
LSEYEARRILFPLLLAAALKAQAKPGVLEGTAVNSVPRAQGHRQHGERTGFRRITIPLPAIVFPAPALPT